MHPCQFDEGEKPVSHCSFSNSVYIPFSVDFSLQGFTPKMQDLNIVFMGAAENSAVAFNVWGLDCLVFYISYRPVDSSSSSGTFFWRVSLR